MAAHAVPPMLSAASVMTDPTMAIGAVISAPVAMLASAIAAPAAALATAIAPTVSETAAHLQLPVLSAAGQLGVHDPHQYSHVKHFKHHGTEPHSPPAEAGATATNDQIQRNISENNENKTDAPQPTVASEGPSHAASADPGAPASASAPATSVPTVNAPVAQPGPGQSSTSTAESGAEEDSARFPRVKAFSQAIAQRVENLFDPQNRVEQVKTAIKGDESEGKTGDVVKQMPKPTGPVVGKLRVNVLQAKALGKRKAETVRGPRRVYVRTNFEGQYKTTPTVNGPDPVWLPSESEGKEVKALWELEVTDIKGDLVLMVMDDRKVISDAAIGQVVIPISSLLEGFNPQPRQTKWYELFPGPDLVHLDTTENKLRAAEHKVKGKKNQPGVGMPKPPAALGFLQVDVEFVPKRMDYPLLSYINSRRYIVPAEEGFDAAYLRRDVARLKRCLGKPHWAMLIGELVQWKYPPFSVAAVAGWIWLCLYGALYIYIPVMTAFLVLGGLRARRIRSTRSSEIVLWEEDADLDVSLPKNAVEKLKKVKDMIPHLQETISSSASQMERNSNLFNWTDERVTMIGLFVVGIATALLAGLFYFIPYHKLLMWVGIGLFSKGLIQRNQQPKVFTPEEEEEAKKEAGKFKKFIGKLWVHIPDALEDTHRLIAERAKSDTLPTQSLLGLPKST